MRRAPADAPINAPTRRTLLAGLEGIGRAGRTPLGAGRRSLRADQTSPVTVFMYVTLHSEVLLVGEFDVLVAFLVSLG